ncbi:MAG: PadR family transcriptional regulator [Lachnospiraceae bacterium]|nr:PadR family transcriptional regulator [Lachnospiraceae bacterium]
MTYQLTAPLLDACVLGIVDQEDSYGYTLTQKMRQIVDISESTLYPVLRRLQKAGQLRTYDAPFQGRNRRYYAITEEGKNLLDFYGAEWNIYKRKIDDLLGIDGKSGTEGGTDE